MSTAAGCDVGHNNRTVDGRDIDLTARTGCRSARRCSRCTRRVETPDEVHRPRTGDINVDRTSCFARCITGRGD